ncbi:MAG: thioredoxin domain-containing protein [Chitinophagales bacterium]
MKLRNLHCLLIVMGISLFFGKPTKLIAKGIHFLEGDWQSTQQVAKQQTKPIFVEIYADNNTTCQEMTNVFHDTALSTYYNEHFVSYRVEADVAASFRAYFDAENLPELLYFDENGHFMARSNGKQASNNLIHIAQKVVHRLELDITEMQKQYDEGFNHPTFLHDFAYKLRKEGFDYINVVNDYIKKQQLQKSLDSFDEIEFVYDFANDLRTEAMDILLRHKPVFDKYYGTKHVNTVIEKVALKAAEGAAMHNNEKLLKRAKEITKQSKIDNAKEILLKVDAAYYEYKQDWKAYGKILRNSLENYEGTNAHFLHEQATALVSVSQTADDLTLAAEGLRKSVTMDNQYYNNESYALVLFQLGQVNQARQIAQNALTIAKTSFDDSWRLEALLQSVAMENCRATSLLKL